MAEQPTPLGLEKIDPNTDQHKMAYDTINQNADTVDELVTQDRAQLAQLAAQVGGQATLATTTPAAGRTPLTVGGHRIMPGVDARYAAFPGATALADGRLLVVWREGTDHVTARDGVIQGATTPDNGVTWPTPAFTLLSMPGVDLRDPTVTLSKDKARLYLTYFKASAASSAQGFFIRTSTDQGVTFGAETRIDAQPYAAGAAPVVEVDGQLFATWYGKDSTGDARDSVYVASSPDGGVTWGNRVKLLDGVAAALDFQEPYLVAKGSRLAIMYRAGNATNIGLIQSLNGGATWQAGAVVFPGTGRPSCVYTSAGTLVCIYRATGGGANAHGVMRYSRDNGATWSQPYLVERATSAYWTYSAPIEIVRGQIFVPSTVEHSGTSSKLSIRYITEGGGISPLGDVPATGGRRALLSVNTLAVADTFDRPDSPTLGFTDNGMEWTSQGGATIKDGVLWDASALTAGNLHYVNALTPDVDMEAEVFWTGNTGMALIFRLQSTTSFMRAVIETTGTRARLYKTVAGTTTQVGTDGVVSMPTGYWHKIRVTAIGGNIRFFVEDALAVSFTENPVTNPTMPWVGLKTGATSAVHGVRNFTCQRRSGIAS